MKNLYTQFTITAALFIGGYQMSAQCSATTPLSSASNIFTLIRNGNNPVAVDKKLNTVLFIHRNNVTVFGGNSGNLRYDLSTNGGGTWTTNIGPVNPVSSQIGRYPNAAIYNPANNTTPSSAYITFFAPTLDLNTSTIWNGQLTGVQQLNGTGLTEVYNQTGVVTGNIPHSLVKGAPGVFWSIEPYSGIGYILYKGVWNNNISNVVWSSNYTITPSYQSGMQASDYNIAFDPTGQYGWVSFAGHLSGGPSAMALYPIFYQTVDGGVTWTGPIQVDLTKMSCLTANTISGSGASVNPEHDLVVDMYGMPHFFTTAGSASSYVFNYGAWHHMYDITLKNGLWLAYDVATAYGGIQTWGTSPDIATQILSPQASRTADGTKVFFSWSDNNTYTSGTSNYLPNLFARGLNVTNGNWSPVKDFTSCNTTSAGKIIFPHAAEEVLEPSNNNYKLATVFAEPTGTNNLLGVANFHFLDNTTFSSTDFSVATPPATITIQQGNPLIYCPGSTLVVNVTNGGQAIWSNGITTPTMGITTGSISTYSVYAQAGCLAGSATFSVVNLSVTAVALTPSVCPQSPAVFSVSGNASTYSWMPGNATGTMVTLNSSTPQVTLIATGSNCTYTQAVNFTIYNPPVIKITGNDTICKGSTATLTATGGSSYLWSDGSTSAVLNTSPTQYTTFVVTATAATNCTNTATFSIFVKNTPPVNASASSTAVCMGNSVSLIAIGGVTYSWSTGTGQNPLPYTPSANTVITVTGFGSNGCGTTASVNLTVYSLPSLTVSSSRSNVCKGEKLTLTVTGATNYTWTTPSSTSHTISIQSASTTDYTVTGKDANGCVNSIVYGLEAKACLSVNEMDANGSIMIYPNPNDGVFTIRLTEGKTVLIYNVSGQVVRTVEAGAEGDKEIKIEGLSSGVYLIRTENSGNAPVKMIVR